MSLLNVWVSPERAIISVDTLGRLPDGRDCETTKILHLAHIHTLFGFRGDRWLVWDMLTRFHYSGADGSYDDAVEQLPELLAYTLREMRASGRVATDYQFAIAGWSPARQRVCGRWYFGRTDDDGYDVEELGARVAPWQDTETARVPDSQDNIRWLAERQASWLRAEGEVGGGRLLMATLTRDAYQLRDLGALG